MNETSSLFLATLLLAVGGGTGYYIYKNSKETNNEDDEVESEIDNIDDASLSDLEIEFDKPKRKSKPKGIRSKKHVKKNSAGTKRRY